MILELQPHGGAGPFCLDKPRAAVRVAAREAGLPLSAERNGLDYFASNAIQVEYGPDGNSEFIGVSLLRPGVFTLTFLGLDLFDAPAEEVFDMFARADGTLTSPYDAEGCTFPRLIVTLWEAEEQYDRIRRANGLPLRPVWAQIGLGTPGHLQAVGKA